ncbi:MAG: AAA family ATPase [Myxococcota bacterium]
MSLLDRHVELAQENERLQRALEKTQQAQDELRELVEQITQTPWYPALFQRVIDTPMGSRAMVWMGGTSRLVNFHPDVDLSALNSGRLVFLDHDRATLMALAEDGVAPPTETASFERLTGDGRIVVQSRGEEIVLDRGGCVDSDLLRPGQIVLFDRPSRMALESMEGKEADKYTFEDVGDVPLDCVGGRREALDHLVSVLTGSLVRPDLAQTYQLGGRRTILLYGPPGCGKTLMARTAASEIQRISGKRCRFKVVGPGEFENAYVGQTEANIRDCFAWLGNLGDDELAVIFFDEIEAMGRSRGSLGAHHSDRFLATLLTEMDGFKANGRKISILAATNRRDLLDPALLSRLSDTQIEVPRPDLRAAREIFEIHFQASLPYAPSHHHVETEPGSQEAAEARNELLDTMVSRLYAPNADNEICRLTLRDGTTRVVNARELMSGRLIEQLALSVREKAFRRHVRGDGRGLCVADAVASVESSLSELSTTLSVVNARAYLDDLPQDIDVVRVEPMRTQPERRHRFYHAA